VSLSSRPHRVPPPLPPPLPPPSASQVLIPLRQYFHSRLFDSGDGPGERRMTVEGIAALEEAIRFCR
jgi:hypothetical protein